MDDEGPRANGRGKADQYKSLRTQWILSQNHIRDQHSMKLAQTLAERDAALHERNIAIAEKKQAIAERDMALMQRDQALNEMNKVIMERDSAMATLEYIRENSRNSSAPTCPSSCSDLPVAKQLHCEAPYCSREPQITETYPTSSNTDNSAKPRREKKQANETKMLAQATTVKGKPRNGKRKKGPEEFDEQNVAVKQLEWKRHDMTVADLNKVNSASKNGWKGQDIGLNDVFFDDSTMPVPGCSCTGIWRQCYKWGNGGWQSACCTTTLSMHPLPMMPNRKHARVGGRKMSGGAFNKLLSRLAAEGHDLSMPVDLKTHWAKHGTNRYITIK